MKVVIRKIENGPINLAILSVPAVTVNAQQKEQIEKVLFDYAHTHVFNGKSLIHYSNVDPKYPSVCVIDNINDIPDEWIELEI